MSVFDIAIIPVLDHEGGFVNNPNDPGGATNWGVSLRWLKSLGDMDGDGWMDGDLDHDGDVDIDDVRNMTQKEAVRFYFTHFWAKYRYYLIPDQRVATKVFDLTVNMGSRQSHKLLQRATRSLGHHIADDGIIGPITLRTINQCDINVLLAAQRSEAAGFYRMLIALKPHKRSEYEDGWLRRAYY